MIKKKLYSNKQKTTMYEVEVSPKGYVREIKLWGPDKESVLSGKIPWSKARIKWADLKKEGGLEYVIFLIYYPAMILKDMKGVPTAQLPSMLKACNIKNEQLVANVLAIRNHDDKKQGTDKLLSKRKR